MTNSNIQSEAISYLQDLYTKNSEGTCWITKNKAMQMRYLWDVIRENYFGVFNKTKDRLGQDKIFYPLTETLTWENVKSIDVDTKDINTRALHPAGMNNVIPCRYIIKDWMYKACFGETLNRFLQYYVLDGHLITKTINNYKNGEKIVEVKFVDQRNCFYDLHCEDIHDTPFLERSIQDLSDVISNFQDKGWINLNKISGRTDLPRLKDEQKENNTGIPEAEMFEYWGKIKKIWITGKAADKDIWVNGIIWASNLSSNALIHKIKESDERSPYEDVAFEDAPNRHPGRGVGEKVIFLQIYLNTLYNIRRNNNLVMMNQLYKFKEGSGVTTEKIAGLIAGGAIGLKEMADFERVDTRNLNFGESLNEEHNLVNVANRVTSNQEAASGEKLPASTPATNAIIQNQAVKSSQQLRQERFGLFLNRLFKNQVLPKLIEIYQEKGILRLDQDKKIAEVKRNIANFYLVDHTINAKINNMIPDVEGMLAKINNEINSREEIFIGLKGISNKEVDIEFFVTDESFDKNTILQNLQQVLVNYKNFAQDPNSQDILREILDILGLDAEHLMPEMKTPVTPAQETPAPVAVAPQPAEVPPTPTGDSAKPWLLNQQTNKVLRNTAAMKK